MAKSYISPFNDRQYMLSDYFELYYYEELTLKEISKVLEVSESRISQLHTKALVKMRKVMGPYMNILMD